MSLGVAYRPRRELNRVSKKGSPGDIRVGILLPLPYRAAMSSLFLHYAYTYLNSLEGVVAYRYVYDIESDTVEALDTSLNPKKLDILLVSLSFELDYVYATRALLKMDLLHRDRRPVIVAGGIAISANPLPMVDIVDGIVVGDAEPVLDELVYSVGDRGREALRDLDCVFVYPLDRKVRKCVVQDLGSAYHPVIQIVPEEEPIYGHGLRVELSRGCPRLCAFCMEGHVFYPFRYRSLEKVLDIVSRGLRYMSSKRVVLYSLSLFDIPYANRFLEILRENGIEASIPSLRPDYLDSYRLELIRGLGQRTLTIAPETLVESIGIAIGKRIDVEKLVSIAIDSYRLGYAHLKLYLITGFPNENAELSVSAAESFIREAVSRGRIARAKFFRFSVNPLIPKPWTPFQYLPPIHVLNLEKNLEMFSKKLRSRFVEVETLSTRWAFAQAVIAQGDERVSKLVLEWASRGLSIREFEAALRSRGIKEFEYIEKGWENPPWMEVVDVGIPKQYLESRYRFLIEKLKV